MKVSIIVPVYNNEKYLQKCIESLKNQHYKDIEVVLVDDGSTDRSGLICDQAADDDDRFKVIHKVNEGVSSARNEGLKHVKGEYIAFCDSDDWISDNMIELLMDIASNNNCDIVVCGVGNGKFEEKNVNDKAKIISREQMLKEIMINPNCFGYVCNKLIKTSIIFNLENPIKFNINFHVLEDQIFLFDCLNYSNNICTIDQKLYHYFQNEDSMLNTKINQRYLSVVEAREEFYNKVKLITNDKELQYLAWSQLIRNICVLFKKVAFAKQFNNKKLWLNKIIKTVEKYYCDFTPGKDFRLKDKMYFWIVKIL